MQKYNIYIFHSLIWVCTPPCCARCHHRHIPYYKRVKVRLQFARAPIHEVIKTKKWKKQKTYKKEKNCHHHTSINTLHTTCANTRLVRVRINIKYGQNMSHFFFIIIIIYSIFVRLSFIDIAHDTGTHKYIRAFKVKCIIQTNDLLHE